MQFGLQLPGTFTARQLMEVAASAEEAGFVQVTLQDNVFMPSPWPLLGALALSTRSLALGPAVSNPVLLHPLEIARQAARLHELAPGRVIVGLGRGSALSAIGAKPQASFEQLQEALGVLRACFEATDSGFRGEWFHLSGVPPRRFKLEAPQIRLIIGGHGPKAAQLAGQLADGLMVAGLWDPDYARELRARLNAASQQAGRPSRPVLIAAPWTVLEPDPERAGQLARATLARSLPFIPHLASRVGVRPATLQQIADAFRRGDLKAAAEAVPQEALDGMVAIADRIGGRIAQLAEAGVDMVAFAGPLSERPEQIVPNLVALLGSTTG